MTFYTPIPDELKEYIDKWKLKKGSLIMILRSVQDYYGYVPKKICFSLAKELKAPLARIYEVLTFYNYFKTESPGKNKIAVCMGTACYLKGAAAIIKAIEDKLDIKESQATKDGLFSLENVRCIGCCGIAPNMRINEKIYGKLNKERVSEILDEYINLNAGVSSSQEPPIL
ncbi:MAG TPA: NAD(P)H-dependent oxidoreductase subunit E [Candidatus Gastranaerophilales bacterium]|nr:NAD(P)H-dependent oxidoreductase subunit E [Candidatus Gastranaerophilales bacterium]